MHPEFSVYVGNLDPDTSLQDMEELIYELFLQVRIIIQREHDIGLLEKAQETSLDTDMHITMYMNR